MSIKVYTESNMEVFYLKFIGTTIIADWISREQFRKELIKICKRNGDLFGALYNYIKDLTVRFNREDENADIEHAVLTTEKFIDILIRDNLYNMSLEDVKRIDTDSLDNIAEICLKEYYAQISDK